MSFRTTFVGLIALVLSASAAFGSPLKDYKGADGGWLVFSISTGPGHLLVGQGQPANTNVVVKFRRVGERNGDSVSSQPSAALFGHSDYSGELDDKTRAAAESAAERSDLTIYPEVYNTQVFVLSLPPGDYEVYSVQLTGQFGRMTVWQTYDERAVPFHIEAGRTSYMGALTPVPKLGKNLLGLPAFKNWALIFNDEHDRDLAIARRNTPGLGAIDDGAQANGAEAGSH